MASSLLEKYPSTAEGHNYVSDLLAVVRLFLALTELTSFGRRQYTRISEEQHATLLEAGESATPSREITPGRGER